MSMKSSKRNTRKTRFHKHLFDSDSPYTHKVERKKTTYTRKVKHRGNFDEV
jgi:hypothetical protein